MELKKKILSLLFGLILLLFFINVPVKGQNNAWIDTVSSTPNLSVRFSVHMTNAEPTIAYQSDIVLPSPLVFLSSSAQLTARSNGHSLSASMISANTLRVIIFSLSATPLNGNDGAVITFDCRAGTLPGYYSVGLQNVVISNATQQNILNNIYPGKFILLTPDIQLSNDSLDFGSIPLGQSVDIPLTINNGGNLPLSLETLSSSNAEITFLDSSAVVVNAYSAVVRTVRFQPLVKGTKNGIVTIKCNDPVDSVRTVKLKAHAYAVNEIHLGSALSRSGYQTSLRIRINNMEQFTAFQCTMPLPSVLKYVPGSASLIGRYTDHSIVTNTLPGNVLRLICFSPTNTHFQGSDGEIAELNFSVEGQGGNYGLPITEGIITDSTGTNILSAVYAGDVRIAAPFIQLASSTMDLGSVSIVDTIRTEFQINNAGDDTLIISSATFVDPSFIVESPFPFVVPQGSSKNISIRFHHGTRGSYSTQLTLVHNDVPRNPAKVNFTASTFVPNKLRIVSNCGSPSDTVRIAVKLENGEPITALQFDINVPTGAVIIPGSISTTDRSKDHSLSSSIIGDGTVRIILFSLSQLTFSGSIGDVVRFRMKLPSSEDSLQISLHNVVISNIANANVVSQTGNAQLDNFTAFAKHRLTPASGAASESFFDSTQVHFKGNVATPAEVTVNYFKREPRTSRLPPGVLASSKYFWKISDTGIKFSSGSISVSLDKLSGVVDPLTLVWLTRESSDDPWINIGGSIVNNTVENSTPITSFSEFAIGTTSSANPLPVEVTNLSLSNDGGRVEVQWSTSTEVNNYGFEVERMFEYSSWRKIGFIDGNGTSNSPHQYRFKDEISQTGKYCYRLKQIDRDGKYHFSIIVETSMDTPIRHFCIQNYPNPFNPSTTIGFTLQVSGMTTLKVFDAIGREVAELANGYLEAGTYHQRTFDASLLSSGIYFARLQNGHSSRFQKMILVK